MKVVDYLTGISWLDDEGNSHIIPVRKYVQPVGQHIEIIAPAANLLPVIDVHVFQKETRIYAWTCSDEQMAIIKERIYSKFNTFAGNSFQLVETHSKKYDLVKEFYCKITH